MSLYFFHQGTYLIDFLKENHYLIKYSRDGAHLKSALKLFLSVSALVAAAHGQSMARTANPS